MAEIHTFNPKNQTIANNNIHVKNKNRICFLFRFQLNKIKNKKINPQYNKNDHHRLSDIVPFWMASIHGKIDLIIKLNTNKDHTNTKLVQNNFRDIFLCCLAKICWINQIQKYHNKIHIIIAQAIFILYWRINS